MKSLPDRTLLHPLTGALVRPIGARRDGTPIWPAMGGDDSVPPAQPPAPPPAQPPVAQPPAPPVPGPPPGYTPPPAAGGPPATPPVPPVQPPTQQDQGDSGFPANTPVADMTPVQQAAYWKHQSRKHESRAQSMSDYESLKAIAAEHQRMVEATQTEHQRAVADALRQGRAEALSEANDQLVEQWFRAAAINRMPQESVDALLQGLDRKRFVANGAVDTDRVWSFVNSLAPAPAASAAPPQAPAAPPVPPPAQPPVTPSSSPDFGQGQPPTARPSGLDAGRAIARERFAKQDTTKPTILQ